METKQVIANLRAKALSQLEKSKKNRLQAISELSEIETNCHATTERFIKHMIWLELRTEAANILVHQHLSSNGKLFHYQEHLKRVRNALMSNDFSFSSNQTRTLINDLTREIYALYFYKHKEILDIQEPDLSIPS